jgi:hypothetical protein
VQYLLEYSKLIACEEHLSPGDHIMLPCRAANTQQSQICKGYHTFIDSGRFIHGTGQSNNVHMSAHRTTSPYTCLHVVKACYAPALGRSHSRICPTKKVNVS